MEGATIQKENHRPENTIRDLEHIWHQLGFYNRKSESGNFSGLLINGRPEQKTPTEEIKRIEQKMEVLEQLKDEHRKTAESLGLGIDEVFEAQEKEVPDRFDIYIKDISKFTEFLKTVDNGELDSQRGYILSCLNERLNEHIRSFSRDNENEVSNLIVDVRQLMKEYARFTWGARKHVGTTNEYLRLLAEADSESIEKYEMTKEKAWPLFATTHEQEEAMNFLGWSRHGVMTNTPVMKVMKENFSHLLSAVRKLKGSPYLFNRAVRELRHMIEYGRLQYTPNSRDNLRYKYTNSKDFQWPDEEFDECLGVLDEVSRDLSSIEES